VREVAVAMAYLPSPMIKYIHMLSKKCIRREHRILFGLPTTINKKKSMIKYIHMLSKKCIRREPRILFGLLTTIKKRN